VHVVDGHCPGMHYFIMTHACFAFRLRHW
jgi:hypothetical protein